MSRRTISSLVGAVLLVGLAAQPAAAATYPITFDYVPIGRAFIFGTATPNATLTLVWKDGNGALKLQQNLTVNEYGDWDYFMPESSSPVVAIGDRLKASDGSSTHTLVIPELTMNINRVNGVMRGRGPAGEYVKLLCNGGPFPTFEPCIWHKKLRVGEDGRWVYRNFANDGLIGGWSMFLRWRNDGGDRVFVEATSPFVAITLGSSRFSVPAIPMTRLRSRSRMARRSASRRRGRRSHMPPRAHLTADLWTIRANGCPYLRATA